MSDKKSYGLKPAAENIELFRGAMRYAREHWADYAPQDIGGYTEPDETRSEFYEIAAGREPFRKYAIGRDAAGKACVCVGVIECRCGPYFFPCEWNQWPSDIIREFA